jgi:hypothetical protein
VPSDANREAAVQLLREWRAEADEVASIVSEQVEFIDQGANLERVSCPNCGSELAVDWWQDAFDRASERQFADLSVATPCCGHSMSLNDLDFDWPAGFARFVIWAMNPADDLTDAQVSALERTLDTPLRRIWRHL